MWALPVARPPDLTQRGQAKIPISHSLHGRSLTACYSSCCYYECWLSSSQEPISAREHFPHTHFSLWLAQTIKPSCQLLPGRSLYIHLELKLFLWLLRDDASNHLALKFSGTHHPWVSQDYIKQNKTAVFEWAASIFHSYPLQAQYGWSRQEYSSFSVSLKGIWLHTFPATCYLRIQLILFSLHEVN